MMTGLFLYYVQLQFLVPTLTSPANTTFDIDDVGNSVTGDRSTNVIKIISVNETSVTYYADLDNAVTTSAAFSARLLPLDALGTEYYVVNRRPKTITTEKTLNVIVHVSRQF